MSRLLQRWEEEVEEHDISKELFLGIMMLMLCLGIMILNAIAFSIYFNGIVKHLWG